MMEILTRDDLIEIIEDKYLNQSESLEKLLGEDFIIDMYINGYVGVRYYSNLELLDCFKEEINPISIEDIGNDEFEVVMNEHKDYSLDDDDDEEII